MKNHLYLILFIFLSSFLSLNAQDGEINTDSTLIQFSGLILDGAGEELEPIPFVTVAIEGTTRGTFSNWEGFFSIVVERGETVNFTAVGYKSVDFTIPDTLTDNRYSLVQLMTMDTINLPETVVFPWPSREHFKLEFLAMEVQDATDDYAEENLDPQTIAAIAKFTPMDGNENSDYYLRQQAKNYYHYGQTAPMNIFNPLAWRDFIKAWKDGKFKRQK